MVYCCVPFCKSERGKLEYRGISFHELPSDNSLREKWLHAISREGDTRGSKWVPSDRSVVCSLHFLPESFRENCKYGKLKVGSVPSVFPEYPSYKHLVKEPARKRRRTSSPSVTDAIEDDPYRTDIKEDGITADSVKFCHVSVQTHDSESEKEDKIRNLTTVINRLRVKIYRLERKIKAIEEESQKINEKTQNSSEIKSISIVRKSAEGGNHVAIYLMDQIHNFHKQRPQWSEQTLRHCICWRIASPKGYEFARRSKLVQAPSRSTLDRYLGTVKCGVGVSPLVKERLKAEAANLEEIEKVASLICDEMSIKERLLYNKEEDRFCGLVEAEGVYNEEIGPNPVLANKLLCFVIHGLSKKYTIPAAYFMVKNLQGNELFVLVQQVLRAVEECGFFVLRLVTDNHRTNVSMFKKFGGEELTSCVKHPCEPSRPLFLSFDYCHIIKNIRSQFLDHDMADSTGIITSGYIKELYRLQRNLTVKPVRYLTRKHVEPSSFEKMNVLCAVQVFSPPMIATIEFMKDNQLRLASRVDFSLAGPTVRFMMNVHKYFTIHDISDSSQHLRHNKPDSMMFYSAADERLQWLKNDFCQYVREVQQESKKVSLKGLTKETCEAMLFTAESTASCIVHLLQNGFFYVLTRKFSGDPVEAMISAVRMGGGNNDMTDSRTAQNAIKRILKSGLMISSAGANIAHNQDFQLPSKLLLANENENEDSRATVVLPQEVTVILESIREPIARVYVTLESASQALVCGYLVRVIEEKTMCSSCSDNVSLPPSSTPLLGLIHHLDRGGLRYPKPQFVSLITSLQQFVESAVPHCKKTACLLQAMLGHIMPPLRKCTIFMCSDVPSHQELVAELVATKYVRPLLANIGKKQTDKVYRYAWNTKPLSRKGLKL